MEKGTLLLRWAAWTAGFTGIVVGTTIQPTSVWAQASHSANSERIESLSFNSSQPDGFEDTGRPANQTSTGSRSSGSCLSRLIALVPGSEPLTTQPEGCSAPDSLLALTLDDAPTFWFYVPPEQLSSVVYTEFVLLDENQRPLYRERIVLSGESGIIGVQLTQPLEVNRLHRWTFQILMTDEPSRDPVVEGFVKRIEPDTTLSNQLITATSPQERIRIYANHGVWHDTLTELAEWRRAHPSDANLESDWTNLLTSVGLEAIANAPLLNCCTSEPISH